MKSILINLKRIYLILGNKFIIELTFLIFFNFISTILDLIGFSIILPIITLLTQDNISDKYKFLNPIIKYLGNPNKIDLLKYFLFFMIILYIIKNIFLAILNLWQYKFVNNIQVKISNKLLKVYLFQSYEFYFERNTTNLFKNVAHEVGQFEYYILQILQLSTEIPIVIGIILILFKVDVLGTSLLLTTSLFSAFLYFIITNKFTKNIGIKRIKFFEKSNQYLMEGLNGIKEIKVLGVENIFLKNYTKYHSKFSKLNYYNSSMSNYPKLWLEITTIICISGYLIFIIEKNNNINNILPFLSIFTLSSFRLMPSFAKISAAIQNLSYRGSVIQLIFNELNLPQLNNKNIDNYKVQFNNEIIINIEEFKYKTSENNILENIQLKIIKNTSIGIIGQSGSGKSTLIDLIIGLIKPNKGNILVDSFDISKNDQHLIAWQKNIGYVPQTIYLTDDTLISNIALGIERDDINEKALYNAINIACLNDLINSLPNGLNTIVGERGVRLSGGQRQRIGIARALYRNPPLLILDEATSALDSLTETKVMENINALGDKTLILIAHRVSTLEKCDVLITMNSGKINLINKK
jgi:ABC-type multidrug transport system fused ATPase/permease subunit